MSEIVKKFKNEWITQGVNSECVNFAEEFGEHLVNVKNHKNQRSNLSTSQIRNFYGEVKKLQLKEDITKNPARFHLLRPKLAYSAQRDGTIGANDFKQVIDSALRSVEPDKKDALQRFQNFCDLLEAILAYHKSYDNSKN